MLGAFKKMFERSMVRKVGELEAKLAFVGQPFQKAGEVELTFLSDGRIIGEAKLGFVGDARSKKIIVQVGNSPIFPVTGTMGFVGCKNVPVDSRFANVLKPGSKVVVTVDGQPYATGVLQLD